VKFYLDDPTMKRDPVGTDKAKPFDLAGTAGSGQARPFSLLGLSAGKHTLTAKVKLANGIDRIVSATFTVAAPVTEPPVAPTSPAPGVGGRPSAATTGVSPGVRLKPSGSVVVSTPGAVVENLDVSGTITVKADNVTIRNVRVRTNSNAYAISIQKGFRRTTVSNAEIVMGVGGTCANAGVGGGAGHTVVRRSHIRGCGDGIKAHDHGLYEDNYIRTTRLPNSTKHVDGIQGSGTTAYTIRRNDIHNPPSQGGNAAVFIQAYNGLGERRVSDVVVDGNWLNGGNMTVFVEDGKTGSGWVQNIRITNNRFGTDYRYGVKNLEGDVLWSGNTMQSDGRAI
jgi:hypothetical protein